LAGQRPLKYLAVGFSIVVPDGDVRGLAPLVKVVGDRPARAALESPDPPPSRPLASTHAAPPLDEVIAFAAEIAEVAQPAPLTVVGRDWASVSNCSVTLIYHYKHLK
jgi:hypothetical protein